MEKKAGFIYRGAALILDSLILLPIMLVLGIILKNQEMASNVLGLVSMLYSWLAISKFGMTLGKRFFHLKVIKVDGTQLGLGTGFVRETVGKFLSSIIFMLGYLWAIWDKDKQSWHDKLAKTYVVQYQENGKGRKILAYLLVSGLPFIAIIGILVAIILIAVNPAAQIRKAQELRDAYDAQGQMKYEFAPLEN
jgi:uncharacterized RDD family membrane protein YckC